MNYSIDDILHIIKMYKTNSINLQENKKEYQSRGVSVISDEITAGGISDVVASEAIAHVSNSLFFSQIHTDMKYLDQRIHRVEKPRSKEVLKLRMTGCSSSDISELIGVSKATTYRILRQVAGQIKGE